MFGKKETIAVESPQGEQEIASVPQENRRKSALREWTESLVFSLIFVFFFTNFVAQATQVPTESMKPTILVGDHFFLDKFAFPANYPAFVTRFLPTREINRGDIVAFKSPENPRIPFIKRAVGLPGETIEIVDKVVFINGKPLDEPYKFFQDDTIYEKGSGIPREYVVRDNFGPLTIPSNSYFMMGDNRDNSNDSRYWGVVSGDNVIGKPLFIYWSYEADPYDPSPKSILDYAKDYASVIVNFFPRTRWSRTGKLLR
ncbi:MAG: signal peptidase I [Acidobacteriota bacterium]